MTLWTLIEQKEAHDALMRRGEVASAIALVFNDKKQKDEFGQALEAAAKNDPDRTNGAKVITLADKRALQARAEELYPAQQFRG